jgi:hypothetical protein
MAAVTDAIPPAEGPDAPTTARRASPTAGAARRRRAPSLKVTVVAAVAGFLVVFELLAYQLRSGHDPAIGSGALTAQVRSAATGSGRTSGSPGAVVTRASGGSTVATSGTQASAAGARTPRPATHTVTTRTSGAGPGAPSAVGDDGYEHEGAL